MMKEIDECGYKLAKAHSNAKYDVAERRFMYPDRDLWSLYADSPWAKDIVSLEEKYDALVDAFEQRFGQPYSPLTGRSKVNKCYVLTKLWFKGENYDRPYKEPRLPLWLMFGCTVICLCGVGIGIFFGSFVDNFFLRTIIGIPFGILGMIIAVAIIGSWNEE